ncbi:BURP domain-containing protein 17-like [Gossypium raimondii]|uniref:BURP domain-containing protein 17-like n=1 Tax=Gossypium raimondii TaxID=29730 RepID=UPI00227D0289|nr:BURP domain-containing protein 17-like [Gossypium raimondii]
MVAWAMQEVDLSCGHGINGARDVKPVPVANPKDLDGKFTISDFHKTVNIGPSISTSLPKKIADSIPFSSSKLPQILQLYSIAPGSSLAKSMADTLPKSKGETKTCATSFQSMVDFVSGAFKVAPQDTKFITTTRPTMSTSSLKNYKVLESPKEIKSSRKAACHPMLYPYAVFFCQYDEELSERVFKVSMVGNVVFTLQLPFKLILKIISMRLLFVIWTRLGLHFLT